MLCLHSLEQFASYTPLEQNMYDPELDARVREYVQFQREVRKVNVIDRDACSQLLALQQRHAGAAQAVSRPLLVARAAAVQDLKATATATSTSTATQPIIPKEECEPAIKSELKSDEVKPEPQPEASGETCALPTPPNSDTTPQQAGTTQSSAAEALAPSSPTGGNTAVQPTGEQPEPDLVLVKSEHDHWRVRVYCARQLYVLDYFRVLAFANVHP